MIRRLSLTFFICGMLGMAGMSVAADETFTVRTLIGGDTTPPTVPADVVATPIAMSQINLSWSPSTDNVLLSGYQIFRDDAQIATTTATTYSDVGLYASTTYSYSIIAFDWEGNVSASSVPAVATTYATPTPTSTPDISGGTKYGSLKRLPLELTRIEIIPAQESVFIQYDTASHIRSVIRWGRTSSYELGSLAEHAFSQHHETEIVGLTPGTTYVFTIEGEDTHGTKGALITSSFTTLPPDDTTPPSNVSGLTLTRDTDDIVLRWQNPLDQDFDHVRIVRNTQFFPADTVDGWVVYEDNGTSARDEGVALPGERIFYTVFSYDSLGNISSGAVISVLIPYDDTGTSTLPVPVATTTDNPLALSIADIQFIQDGHVLPLQGDTVTIDGAKRLIIAIPYTRLPEHLKTILVTLVSPTDTSQTAQFLLRINHAKDGYVAEIAPLGIRGVFPFRVSVFDYTTAHVGYISGTITSEIVTFASEDMSTLEYLLDVFMRYAHISYLLWFILVLIMLTYLSKRLMEKQPTQVGE